MILRDKFFINGQWATPSSRETIDVHNAGTGEVMGKVPAGGEKDVDEELVARNHANLQGAGSYFSRGLTLYFPPCPIHPEQ